MGVEERADPRAEVDLEVRYSSADEFLTAYAKNISGGGVFIRTVNPLPLNGEAQIRFSLPGIPHPFAVKGLVVWTNPYASRTAFPTGMGIKFVELDPDEKEIIDGFVRAELARSGPEAASPAPASPEA
jgi:uncharacterized protein (TIGR02266 family)